MWRLQEEEQKVVDSEDWWSREANNETFHSLQIAHESYTDMKGWNIDRDIGIIPKYYLIASFVKAEVSLEGFHVSQEPRVSLTDFLMGYNMIHKNLCVKHICVCWCCYNKIKTECLKDLSVHPYMLFICTSKSGGFFFCLSSLELTWIRAHHNDHTFN